MFTGIIKHVGKILESRKSSAGLKLKIELGPVAKGLSFGDSVAVNGVCLTATEITPTSAEFDVMAESIDKSNLGQQRVGSKVNLEPALRVDQGLDGHIVQGHIDGTAKVVSIKKGTTWDMRFKASSELVGQMVPKGSVAINGVSLTLIEAAGEFFSVGLIPTTLDETNLTSLASDDIVNIEADVLGKYVRHYLTNMLSAGADGKTSGGLTLEKLKQAGFM